jgi:hypothetical protein
MSRIAGDLSELAGTTKKMAFRAIEQTVQQPAAEGKSAYDAVMNFNARADAGIVKAWEQATGTGWGRSLLNSGTLRKNLQSQYGVKDIADAPLMQLIERSSLPNGSPIPTLIRPAWSRRCAGGSATVSMAT